MTEWTDVTVCTTGRRSVIARQGFATDVHRRQDSGKPAFLGARSRRRTQILARTGAVKIENTGVEPDITVENMPNATFKGGVAQLDAAIGFLLEKLKTDPVRRL
jgi:hypothetical protein